jgi:HK97 gp10 family phage protein
MHFDVSELRDLERDLEKGAAKVEELAPLVVKKSALDIEADAKINSPVDTGLLMNSISSTIEGLSAEIGPDTEYEEYVEHGTSKMVAQPYMLPAFEKHAPQFEDAMGKVAEKIL